MAQAQEPETHTEPGLTLQDCMAFGWGLSCLLICLMTAILGMNWLGNFLHAPIGIKDNPPEPNAVVQLTQFAFWPVFVLFGVMLLLKNLTIDISLREFFKGSIVFTLLAAPFALLIVLIGGLLLHREFIPGTYFFWNTLAPILFTGGLLLYDCLWAYVLVRSLKITDTARKKFAAVFIGLSAVCGIVGFAGLWVSTTVGASLLTGS